MTRLLLDTSAYSMLQRGHSGIRDALRAADAVHVSPVVLGELHAGFARGHHKNKNEALLKRFLSAPRVVVSNIGEATALCFAQIVNYLRVEGRPIPTNDIWIAAGAMELGLRVVTTDAHFRGIPQVQLEYHRMDS